MNDCKYSEEKKIEEHDSAFKSVELVGKEFVDYIDGVSMIENNIIINCINLDMEK